MKKILLFMFMVFIFSVGYSGNIIVAPNGDILEDCGNNNYQFPGNCPKNSSSGNVTRYFGGTAVNPETGKWGSTYNYTNAKQAKKDAMSRCGSENCKYVGGDTNSACVSAAYSSTNKILTFETVKLSMFGSLAGIPDDKNERKNLASEKALKKCKKNGGTNCKILTTICTIDD